MISKENKRLTITLNRRDIDRLEVLSKKSGLSLSQQVKELIIEEYYKKGVKA